jgi:histidinol dehydrogenase
MNAPALRILRTTDADFEPRFQALKHWSAETDRGIEERVESILADVRARGDAALLETTARFDGVQADSVAALEISRIELQAALDGLPPAQREALQQAADRIRRYHERQLQANGQSWQYRDEDGTLLGQKVTPLDRVGIYVPGGKAAYPSSVLMNAIPAQVAGVGEIVMVVPTPRGERNPLVLAAAAVAGVHRVFTLGGAQAVGALAYGTATVPRVDKITGPGNAYVASAKRRVFGEVGIDMIAGPSEILVLADGTTPADWVAMDLFSQAEHDELAQSILLCPDAAYVQAVAEAVARLLPEMPRRDVIRASLEGRGALIVTRSMEEACELSNRIAPEHLEVSSAEPHRWEPLLRHAGAIFLGAYTSESLGDYCAGPNHVLPTSGTARFSSPLSVFDFQKRSSLIEVSAAGAQPLGRIASVLAHGEGLQAHARAAEMRLAEESASTRALLAASARPAASASPELRVAPVDAQNVDAVLALKVAPSQRTMVASPERALAQAAYEPRSRALALLEGDSVVGLVTLYDARTHPERPDNLLYLWRLMIDERHQRRGLGRAAIAWLREEALRLGFARIGLSHATDPGHAGPFYQQLGFVHTGEVVEGQLRMVLELNAAGETA